MAEPDAKAVAHRTLSEILDGGGDLGYMEETLPQLTALAAELAAPDFVCVLAGIPPTPEQEFPGVEGIARAWSDYGAAWEKVRAELEEVRETDDHIVLLVTQVATTRHQGVEISQPSAMVFAFEDGRLTRLEFHLDRAHALRRAGIEG